MVVCIWGGVDGRIGAAQVGCDAERPQLGVLDVHGDHVTHLETIRDHSAFALGQEHVCVGDFVARTELFLQEGLEHGPLGAWLLLRLL